MDMNPDDHEVMRISSGIVKISKERGKTTSVGGTITKTNFYQIMEVIQPDSINSRHIGVDLNRVKSENLQDVPEKMLSFEIELYNLFSLFKPERSKFYQLRIDTNRERIGLKKVIYSIR